MVIGWVRIYDIGYISSGTNVYPVNSFYCTDVLAYSVIS